MNLRSLIGMQFLFIVLLVLVLTSLCDAIPPMSVTANVRGKRYEVEAETVEDVCSAVSDLAGLEAKQQSVLFRGKLLSLADKLKDAGVSPGDTLNVVKGRRQRQRASSGDRERERQGEGPLSKGSRSGSESGSGSGAGGMGMGGLGGLGGLESSAEFKSAMDNLDPKDMQKAMQAMNDMLDSDVVDEYFADEERLESARQQLLDNLDQYEGMMPGFKQQAEEIASSPERWRQAMGQARDQIAALKKQRDQMRGSGGGMAPGSGLFPGMSPFGAGAGAGSSGSGTGSSGKGKGRKSESEQERETPKMPDAGVDDLDDEDNFDFDDDDDE